jgi:hypothetical protein
METESAAQIRQERYSKKSIHCFSGTNTSLRSGLEKTHRRIYEQYLARERGEAGVVRETLTDSHPDCREVRRNELLA